MVARALQLWQEYEQRWNVKLFFRSGALRMAGADDSYESAALPVLKDAEIRFEKLSVPDCAKRWPQINFDGVSWSVYEPDSGFLAARLELGDPHRQTVGWVEENPLSYEVPLGAPQRTELAAVACRPEAWLRGG